MSDEKEIIETLQNLAVDKYIDERKLEEKDVEAIINIIVLYMREKEKNKKAIKYCKEKSTFQTFGDFELQNVLETYINRLKHRILDILEE